MSEPFDVIPFEVSHPAVVLHCADLCHTAQDIKGDWKKLGSGSFGNVYKGTYLGIEVAIKEVLPSTEYDVAKYFEREWRLLKESRHPNVVLYLGLSRAPEPDGRIFIISEFIENGNLRMYIFDKSKPFPWRLRMSFATDIARALTYLHARKCIHRDLKGENLLVTANGRLKITDFGFARIAARNEEESRRLTFCGTDAYMSPEILLGEEFDLPTDIFSLGVIFAEIAARRLADDTHFKRAAPAFTIHADEVHRLASPGCPPAFIQLTLDCLVEEPAARPKMRVILERLAQIEAEILARPSEDDMHTGSVKFMTGRRPGAALRIPSFGQGIGKSIRGSSIVESSPERLSSDDDSDDELLEAVSGLQSVTVIDPSAPTILTSGSGESQQPLIDGSSSTFSDYSTTVIRAHPHQPTYTTVPSLSSILTIRANGANGTNGPSAAAAYVPEPTATATAPAPDAETSVTPSALTIDSYYTAPSSGASIAAATEGGSTLRSLPHALVHRFTLIKPGAKSLSAAEGSWGPLDFFFSSGLLGGAKCDICAKRLGRKAVLECDDCGLRAHIKCGEVAPRDCGVRPTRPPTTNSPFSASPPSKSKSKSPSPFSR
ncbi:kinase-like protein [Auriscalpium vulgare]|uniref:Kinase-like protein n=1 Tax=Auriscalpium vulgare TaxID=40419 RepID=A0ACB8RZL0_9AGAM|nr:kinase-like protein [Auriscalpium vulgare]